MNRDEAAVLAQLAPRERAWLRWLRRIGWAFIGLYFIAALALLGARYYLLPELPDQRERIAQAASEALGQRITIEAVSAEWYGFHPWLQLQGVTVHDDAGRPALHLPSLRVVVAWRSLAARELRLRSLLIERPELTLRRAADGTFYIAGIPVRPRAEAGDDSAADWLLRQGEVHVRDGRVVWHDEQRGAPPLELHGLQFLLRNSGSLHEFALRATPPPAYGSPLDVRGQVNGRSFARLGDWNGRLYAAVESLDLGVWRQWVDYPIELHSGRGALRLWLSLAQFDVSEARAHLALHDVTVRMAADLPELELAALRGELSAKESYGSLALLGLARAQPRYEVAARELEIRVADSEVWRPADFVARWRPGENGRTAGGVLRAAHVDLEPLAALSDYFVLPERFRTAIQTVVPRGVLHDVRFRWRGPLEAPARYSARGRFAGIGMAPYLALPGFDRLDGDFELSEQGGRVRVEGHKLGVQYPGVFAVEQLELDRLAARVNWRRRDQGLEVRIEDVLFENSDVAGSLSGSVHQTEGGAHMVDLSARASRADGTAVYRYIPHLPEEVSEWLQQSILAGTASDVRFRLRGALDDFPYRDPQTGEFRISARLAGVRLRYDSEWPEINDIHGDIRFNGPELAIHAARATSLGAQLADVHARFADVYQDDPLLHVAGQARGPSNEFLKFIAQSPVREFIGGLTDDWTASGSGVLQLSLDLPLGALDDTRVTGHYEVERNSLVMGQGESPMTQVSGRVDFTERGASSPGLSGQYLGGPLTVQITQRDDAIITTAKGTAEAAGLMRVASLPLADRVQGKTAYSATFVTRDAGTNMVFESNFEGVRIDLPAPLGKVPGERWPVRIERTAAARGQQIDATIGRVLKARAQLRPAAKGMVLDRAGVAIGDAAVPVPADAHIAVAVNVPRFDADALAPLAMGEGDGSALPPVGVLNLRAAVFQGAGRLLHDVDVRAQRRASTWRAEVQSREIKGEVAWRPDGDGTIMARLSELVHPEPVPGVATDTVVDDSLNKLPALDVVADRYVLKGRDLGRLELQAYNQRRGGWRIERATLSTDAGEASVKGLWRPPGAGVERTELDFRVTAHDIGAYLARLGYADMVREGEGELSGQVSWNGPPTTLDYRTLMGKVEVRAEDGQFVQIKPGVGRLLGVLSLQALPRRITLDFKDVFGEGFAFDRIDGTATITQGILYTTDLGMIGPSARAVITGSVDLETETQDLHVRVVPTVGDSVAAAAGLALLNPVVGVGVWVAQKLLRDPIGQMLAFEYAVSGNWTEPQVERLRAPANAADEG